MYKPEKNVTFLKIIALIQGGFHKFCKKSNVTLYQNSLSGTSGFPEPEILSKTSALVHFLDKNN